MVKSSHLHRTAKLKLSVDEASTWLARQLDETQKFDLQIPTRSDGSTYEIHHCMPDQLEVVTRVMEHARSVMEGNTNADRTLRLTVAGCAGSGKSTVINTIVTALRRMFQINEVVHVFAPTGSAAFNAGGETVHRGFQLPKIHRTLDLSAEKTKNLAQKFNRTIAVIVDERSMLDATMFGAMESHCRQSLRAAGRDQPRTKLHTP